MTRAATSRLVAHWEVDPITKCRRYHSIPWDIVAHVAVLIAITAQIVLLNHSVSAAHLNYYSAALDAHSFQNAAFSLSSRRLFVKALYPPNRDDLQGNPLTYLDDTYFITGVTEASQALQAAMEGYFALPSVSLGRVDVYNATNPDPMIPPPKLVVVKYPSPQDLLDVAFYPEFYPHYAAKYQAQRSDDFGGSNDDTILQDDEGEATDDEAPIDPLPYVQYTLELTFHTLNDFRLYMEHSFNPHRSAYMQSVVSMRLEFGMRNYNVERVGLSSSACSLWDAVVNINPVSATSMRVTVDTSQSTCHAGWESASPVLITSGVVLLGASIYLFLLVRRLYCDCYVIHAILKLRKQAQSYFTQVRASPEVAMVPVPQPGPAPIPSSNSSINSPKSSKAPATKEEAPESLRAALLPVHHDLDEEDATAEEKERLDHNLKLLFSLTHELPKSACFYLIRPWDLLGIASMGLSVVYCILLIGRGDDSMQDLTRVLLAFSVFSVWVTLIQYFRFYPSLYGAMRALDGGFKSSMKFAVSVVPLFLGFCVYGSVIFGHESDRFNGLTATAVTLFAVLNGDVMRETFLMASSEDSTVESIFSQLYLYLFCVAFMYIVLMCLTIIIEDAFFRSEVHRKRLEVVQKELELHGADDTDESYEYFPEDDQNLSVKIQTSKQDLRKARAQASDSDSNTGSMRATRKTLSASTPTSRTSSTTSISTIDYSAGSPLPRRIRHVLVALEEYWIFLARASDKKVGPPMRRAPWRQKY